MRSALSVSIILAIVSGSIVDLREKLVRTICPGKIACQTAIIIKWPDRILVRLSSLCSGLIAQKFVGATTCGRPSERADTGSAPTIGGGEIKLNHDPSFDEARARLTFLSTILYTKFPKKKKKKNKPKPPPQAKPGG